MTMTKHDEDALMAAFAAARTADTTVTDDLTARVLADAQSALTKSPAPVQPRPSLLNRALDALGGWPAMGGVVAAGVGGLWIGIAPPAGIEDWAASLVGTTQEVSLFMDIEDMALEAIDG